MTIKTPTSIGRLGLVLRDADNKAIAHSMVIDFTDEESKAHFAEIAVALNERAELLQTVANLKATIDRLKATSVYINSDEWHGGV